MTVHHAAYGEDGSRRAYPMEADGEIDLRSWYTPIMATGKLTAEMMLKLADCAPEIVVVTLVPRKGE